MIGTRAIATLAFTLALLSSPGVAAAQEAEVPVLDATCRELFSLPADTMTRAADTPFLDKEVCRAYQFLISRYDGWKGKGVTGLENAKVQGITKLNPGFAVQLAHMLENSPNIRIQSAYRTPAGQAIVNRSSPNSNHIKGCAVDLQYDPKECNSTGCLWTLRHSTLYGIHIRMKRPGEWNHIEPVDLAVCQSSGTGHGGGTAPPRVVPPNPARDLICGLMSCSGRPAPGTSGSPLTTPDSGACLERVYCARGVVYSMNAQCVETPINYCGQFGCHPNGLQCDTTAGAGGGPSQLPGKSVLPGQTDQQNQPGQAGRLGTGTFGNVGQNGQPLTPPPPGNTAAYAPGSCSAEYICGGNNVYFRTYSCVDQLSEMCASGCANGACKPAPATTNLSTSTPGVTIDQLIAMLARDIESSNAPTASTTVVVVTSPLSREVIAQLRQQNIVLTPSPLDPTLVTASLGTQATSSGVRLNFIPDNTFGSPHSSDVGTAKPQGALKIYINNIFEKVKAVLTVLWPYVQPFGGVVFQGENTE